MACGTRSQVLFPQSVAKKKLFHALVLLPCDLLLSSAKPSRCQYRVSPKKCDTRYRYGNCASVVQERGALRYCLEFLLGQHNP